MKNLFLLLIFSFAYAQKAGVAAGMDHSVISNWKHVVVPSLIDIINSIRIPEIHDSQDKAKDIVIALEQVDPDNVVMGFDPVHNGLYVQITNI